MATKIREITIGTDPEFIMVDKYGQILDAEDISFIDRNTAFGSDTEGIFEVRSAYSHNTIHVVDDIRDILQKAYDTLDGVRGYKWMAGHYPHDYALGGHIHIGRIVSEGHDTNRLVDCLAYYLIDGLSNLIDDKEQRQKRRTRTGYGGRTNFRLCNVQRDPYALEYRDICKRVEYRAPGSFLISPEVTFLNLVLAKVASMWYFYNDGRNCISRTKRSPKDIIYKALGIMEHTIFMDEEDVALCQEILPKYINDNIKIDWTKDFKLNWRIR